MDFEAIFAAIQSLQQEISTNYRNLSGKIDTLGNHLNGKISDQDTRIDGLNIIMNSMKQTQETCQKRQDKRTDFITKIMLLLVGGFVSGAVGLIVWWIKSCTGP